MPLPALNLVSTPQPVAVVHARYTAPPAPPRRMKHRYHHISLLLQGEGRYRVGPELLPLGAPVAVFLPAGDDDVNALVGPVESWYTGFRWPGLKISPQGRRKLVLSWSGRRLRLRRWKTVDAVALTRMTELYSALQTASLRQDLSGTLQARGLLLELFAFYADLPEGGADTLGHRALMQFCQALREETREDVRIERVAAEAGITPDHLRDLFRERFGMRPVEYRRGLQLARARELLSTTSMNVKEVARRVGYQDALYFSRVFKRQFGISPRQIVRSYRFPAESVSASAKAASLRAST